MDADFICHRRHIIKIVNSMAKPCKGEHNIYVNIVNGINNQIPPSKSTYFCQYADETAILHIGTQLHTVQWQQCIVNTKKLIDLFFRSSHKNRTKAWKNREKGVMDNCQKFNRMNHHIPLIAQNTMSIKQIVSAFANIRFTLSNI